MYDSKDDLVSLSSFGSGVNSLNDSSSSVFSFQALFGGQLTGRQYNAAKINPLFLECNTNDDVTLDISTRSLGRADNSVHIGVHGGITRRYSTPDVTSADQHDSGVSSDISSGDSQVGAANSSVLKNVERNDSGEIVLTLNRKPNSVHGSANTTGRRKPARHTNSLGFETEFGSETRMIVNGNSISFVKELVVNGDDFNEGTLQRRIEHGSLGSESDRPTFTSNGSRSSPSDDVFDADSEDHYQTIDAVILPDPDEIADSRLDNNDSKSDSSDDIAQLYAQVRKGAPREFHEPETPLYTSTVIVDGHDRSDSAASCASHDEYDSGTIKLNPMYHNGEVHNDAKPAATKSLSTSAAETFRRSAVDSLHKPNLVRAHSADDMEFPDYWNPNKIGKRRKKNRSYSANEPQQVDASPGKELKSILVSAGSNCRPIDDSPATSRVFREAPLVSHVSLSEQKSVKFSDDTVDNEYKAKHYRQEVIDLCELHRQQNDASYATTAPVYIEEVPFDGSFSWPAQPRDDFLVENGYCNNNFHDTTNPSQCACRSCCGTCNAPQNGHSNCVNATHHTPDHLSPSSNAPSWSNTLHDHNSMPCSHGPVQRLECPSCLDQRRKLHLQRRRTIMRWSLLVFLIVIVVGLVVGLAAYFGTKSKT